MKAAELAAVARRARREGERLDGTELRGDRQVVGDRPEDPLDRLGRELAGDLDAAAEPGHARLAPDHLDPPVADVGYEQPGRVRPHVNRRDAQGPRS